MPAAAPASATQWKHDLRAWCDALENLLSSWNPDAATGLFDRMEVLSALPPMQSDPILAECSAGMLVYLCTFADSQAQPDAEQQQRLKRLLADVRTALDAVASMPPIAPQAAAAVQATSAAVIELRPATQPRRFLIVYLCSPGREEPGLAAAIGQQRISVLPVHSPEAAAHAIAREPPDAVLLDADFLRMLPQLADAARRQDVTRWRRVLWIATGIGGDVSLRFYAQRAGIDLVLENLSPEHAAATLLASLLRRREEGYRVLLVEDDPSQAVFCSSLLRHQGFEVDVAESAAEAQALVDRVAPDLILLDINLPDMSGIELAQLIRERDSLSHVPIVFLTGEDDIEVRAEAIAAGGDDFLSKPVRPRHLIANVNSRIGRARALAAAGRGDAAVNDGLSPRLDRLRFVEAMDRVRRDATTRSAVAVLAMDDIAAVAKRLGFVRTGDLANQIALAIESEVDGSGRTCGIGEFSRLVLLQAASEHGLRQQAEALRQRLDARAWLSTRFPLKVRFTAAVVRFDGSPQDADSVIADALALLDATRREGLEQFGWRSLLAADDEDGNPLRRIARLMLGQPLTAASGRLEFRALMPLRGTRTGQFLLRTGLLPPGSRRGTLITPADYADVALSLGVTAGVDRLSLRLARQHSRSALIAQHGWTALLPVSEAALQEPLFAEWLQRDGPPSAEVRLLVRADRLRAGSGLAAAVDRIAQCGWRWMLHLCDPGQFDAAVLALENLDAVIIERPLDAPETWAIAIAAAQSHGKSIIASGLDELKQVTPLFALGVHYAFGDSVGEWTDEPTFDLQRLESG